MKFFRAPEVRVQDHGLSQTFHYYHSTRDARAGTPGLATFWARLQRARTMIPCSGRSTATTPRGMAARGPRVRLPSFTPRPKIVRHYQELCLVYNPSLPWFHSYD